MTDMRPHRPSELEPYLAHLQALPFVRNVRVDLADTRAGHILPDALLRLRTPSGEHALHMELKRTHVTRPLVNGLLNQMRAKKVAGWILFAPYIGAEIGGYLRENKANYVDAAGNCFVTFRTQYIALVEGRRPPKRTLQDRGIRGPGYQILFAILARPELLDVPVRTLAEAAGAGKSATAQMLKRLEAEGLVGADRTGRRLLQPQRLMDRWLTGYATTVRPRLVMGRFRTNDPDTETLEARIASVLGETVRWAWCGRDATHRILPWAGHVASPGAPATRSWKTAQGHPRRGWARDHPRGSRSGRVRWSPTSDCSSAPDLHGAPSRGRRACA